MTDRELLELIAAQVGNLTNDMDKVIKDIDNITKDVSELKEGQNRIENEIGEFREETSSNFIKLEHYTHDVDTKNADRHFDFVSELKDLKHSVNRIEVNTAENWRDIARLKSIRKYKTK